MKSMINILIIIFFVQICASNPSSENYSLQQSSVATGSDPANSPISENYILQSSLIGNISGEEQSSENYINIPGYYSGEILGEILPPQNVTISVVDNNVQLNWAAVSGATSYKVFSSDDPYSGFQEDISGTLNGESWSAPIPNGKKFYYVKAVQ